MGNNRKDAAAELFVEGRGVGVLLPVTALGARSSCPEQGPRGVVVGADRPASEGLSPPRALEGPETSRCDPTPSPSDWPCS